MSGDVRLPAITLSPSSDYLAAEEQGTWRSGTRTPRPYYHEGEEIRQHYEHDGTTNELIVKDGNGNGLHNTSHPKPSASSDNLRGARSGRASTNGSDSGTEADDERPNLVRALPAPHLRPRKGLKTGEINADVLLTPSQLDDEGRRLSQDYFKSRSSLERSVSREEKEAEQEKVLKIRLAEFARRVSEVALMAVLTLCVLGGKGVLREAYLSRRELIAHVVIIVLLVLTYPVKLSVVDGRSHARKVWHRFRVPASFDPATVLYPTLLPVLVALSVAPANPAVVLPNVILGLSSLPQRLFPRSSRLGGYNVLHWFVSVVPLIVAERTEWPSKQHPAVPYMLRNSTSEALWPETLASLYPLHHALLQPLQHLTTTSLLVSELHLLSAALINLLFLAQSPQAVILKACLWIGGVSIFVLCASILKWNVTLMRVPRWRYKRGSLAPSKEMSFIGSLLSMVRHPMGSMRLNRNHAAHSDADEDEGAVHSYSRTNGKPSLRVSSSYLDPSNKANGFFPQSAIEPTRHANGWFPPFNAPSSRPRSNTLPTLDVPATALKQSPSRARDRSPRMAWYFTLTAQRAQERKVLYALFVYLSVLVIILLPVRYYVGTHALHNHEPVGWAVGYLAGQIPTIRSIVHSLNLQSWIALPLPPPSETWTQNALTLPLNLPLIRTTLLGPANTRLLLILYWALVLSAGLLAVFSLTAFVEVDTRRKVFHGVMVAMMLPSTFVDPCACALALALILAVFLLLEVIRAGQVLPLGNVIGRFVAPYVDGRDLRGPVVVSHIFLLIGCAVPLWFSLASIARAGNAPWKGWESEEEKREVAMVAGVICVGMGDAAASLIGRRYGRHKWIWVGGKSLEGSAAFAFAVTLGLVASKAWLLLGGWNDVHEGVFADYLGTSGLGHCVLAWSGTVFKATFCACAASFMEAILTGANDNVVVPVALWLLVKGVGL